MNICLLPSAELSYESGSTIYANLYIDELIKNGHTVNVICSSLPGNVNKQANYILLDIMKHPVIDDYYISNDVMMDSVLKIYRCLCELNHNRKIDIIHAHYATINSMAALLYKVMVGTPYVISCFGRDVFNGSMNDDRYYRMCKVTIEYADYIICSNCDVMNRVIEMSHDSVSKTSVLPMPLEDVFFIQKRKRKIGNEIRILSVVSCMSQEKGIQVTLEALKCLIDDGFNTILYIVGVDDNPEQKNIIRWKEMSRKLKVDSFVKWIGAEKHSNVAHWIDETDILIDSRYVGNFSSIVLEGIAKGTVIIASDVKGNRELITCDNGLLYKVYEKDDLYKKVKKIISNEELRQLCMKNCNKWITQNGEKYKVSEHIKDVEDIYYMIQEQRKGK
ncbi:MAG: glycosyltransferase family 4 protein [Lachnospiraceae bacterium]|nr:glycosyltransferase family 4 protein [Lachnospiraceae bacterium]